jgi:hypothetical protein
LLTLTRTRHARWAKISRIAGAVMLAAFFFAFQKRVLKAYFGPDEMMNIYGYWDPPLWKVFLANLSFWSKFVRPMAGVYYLPLYHFFKLNPIPYSVVRIALLAVNTFLFYKLARSISGSWWVAVLASFPVAYQAGLGYLAFDGAYIYDALCGGFFFAALLYYIHARRGREHLSVGQASIFLVLYICALDSKEMAVALPVVALAYELLFEKHRWEIRGLLKQFWPTLGAGGLTLVYIIGKATGGAGSLTNMDAYRPVITWARFSESTVRFMNTMFYAEGITMEHTVTMWALLLCAGLVGLVRRPRNPRWLFLWIWVMVTPLPIVFLPGRGGALLYLIAAGWAIAVAMMLRALSWRLSRELFQGRASRRASMAVCLLLCAVVYADETRSVHRYQVYGFLLTGKETAETIQRLKQLGLQPKPGSKIVFLRDPAPTTFDITFISALTWNDHSLRIWQQGQSHFPPAEVAGMDYIIDYTGDRFVVLKQPS